MEIGYGQLLAKVQNPERRLAKFRKFGILCIMIFILCVIGCSPKDEPFNHSSLNQDFPVPKTAELQEKQEYSEEYAFKDVKEENGLPDYYRKEIERRGWVEADRLGSKYTFQNGDKKIHLIVLTEKIIIQL